MLTQAIEAKAEAVTSRFKRVIGDGLRSRTDQHRAIEVDATVHTLNCLPELEHSTYVRIA